MPIRIAVSGEMHGPELPDTIYLLGREKSIQHIESMLEKKSDNYQKNPPIKWAFVLLLKSKYYRIFQKLPPV